jgi:predicted TIM-barrel fold metal-dependent hydrolase
MREHIVISMDSHTELAVDLKPYLPRNMHETFDTGVTDATRWFASALEAFDDMMQAQEGPTFDFVAADRDYTVENYHPEALPAGERLELLDEDGVAGEFIVPFIGAHSTDPVFLHACSQAYDRYFTDYVSVAPHRFGGANVGNLCGGVEMVLDEIASAHEHGLRAVELSGNTAWVAPDLPPYNSTLYDPLWAALAEREMAVVFHSGWGRAKPLLVWDGTHAGWEIERMIDITRGHFGGLAQLLVAGIPERFPGLRIGYLESGTRWIPPLLAELDLYAKSGRAAGLYRFDFLPSEQWSMSCFAGGPLDRDQVEKRHELGVDNLVWGSDFPHVEGTWPRSRSVLADLFSGVPDDETRAIIGANAARIMGFDLDALAATPAAAMPWPDAAFR